MKKLILSFFLLSFSLFCNGMDWKVGNSQFSNIIAFEFVGNKRPLPIPTIEGIILPISIPQRKTYSLDDCNQADPTINV